LQNLFYKLGLHAGRGVVKGKWILSGYFGSDQDFIRNEFHFGLQLSREVEKEMKSICDPPLLRILNDMHGRLTEKVRNKERQFYFKVFDSQTINAFALPGGFIYASSALAEMCRHRTDALAFIFAHEMIHIIQRHAVKRMVANGSAALIISALQTANPLGNLAKKAVAEVAEKGYSRKQETEADHYGLRLAYSAGFDPAAAIWLMQAINQWDKNETGMSYFQSHPPMPERISRLMTLLTQLE
jgi:predicted Zn-dependent protease